MTGQMIEVTASDGGAFGAYLALPESGGGPGLVLLQEIFGVNANIATGIDSAVCANEGGGVVGQLKHGSRSCPGRSSSGSSEPGSNRDEVLLVVGGHVDVARCIDLSRAANGRRRIHD